MNARLGIYLVFVLSGAAGLTYQIIWARWLGFVFGGTTTSVSIVLSGFMLGLALGSGLAGRALPRIQRPLRAYGLLELGVGAFAAAFPWITAACDAVFTGLVDQETSYATSLAVRSVLALAVLVVPTACMGATLPLLTEYFRRESAASRGWKAGLLYAANTIGAALGTLGASFFGIELLGVRNTTLLAASLNFLVAAWALNESRRLGESGAGSEPPRARAVRFDHRLAMAVLAASGAAALASEVLWTRALESLVGNSSYAFALILVVYLVGIAVGSWLFSLFVKRLRNLPLWLLGTQAAIAAWMVVATRLFLALAESLRERAGQPTDVGELLMIHLQSALFLLPLAIGSGAAFPIATRLLEPESGDAHGGLVGRAYAWNTLGAVAGSLGGGFVVAPHLDFFQSIHALVAFYAATALAGAVAVAWARRAGRVAALVSAAVALALVGLGTLRSFDPSRFEARVREQYPHLELLYHRPGLQGVTSVLHRRGASMEQSTLLVNGIGMTRLATVTKNMAHLPMLAHPDPEDTLVICFGMGTTYRSAMRHGGRVTAVELVGEVLDAFDLFHEDAGALRRDPRGRLVTNDGRNYLKISRERYDVITIDPPPPIDGAGVNHLYSAEFLTLARDHLKEGGILAHWIPKPGTKAGVNDLRTFRMLLKTFVETFDYVRVAPGRPDVGLHVLGSQSPIDASPEAVAARLGRRPGVLADIREWEEVPLAYFSSPSPPDPEPLRGLDVVTDDRPRLEFDLIRAWRTDMKKQLHFIWW